MHSLETVVQLACEKASGKDGSLAVMHILHSITQAQWESFASSHNLANWISIPLQVTQAEAMTALMEALERLAFQRDHDFLTGIGNRRLFDRHLSRELERASRSHTELSLFMIDLDNFKQVNDTYGHDCGDIVLQRLAEILRHTVRPYDTVARIGGEEFAIILPSTPSWTAHSLAKRMLELFSKETFTYSGKKFHMTFSGGIASLGLLSTAPSTAALMKNADTALYAAKAQGKNRVTVMESKVLGKDKGTLVRSHEKQFLFSCQGLE